MRSSDRQSDFLVAAGLLAVALGLLIVPRDWSDGLRAAALDATLPGQRLVQSGRDWPTIVWNRLLQRPDNRQEVHTLEAQLAEWKLRYRQLEVESAALRAELCNIEQHRVAAYAGQPGQPLIVPQLLEATVLGEEFPALWSAGYFVDRGSAAGVVETALVLDNAQLKIDQGSTAQLESGQPVYAGRSVVGRVALVGTYMSTIRRVTDADYRGLAQIIRNTSQGKQFGAQGELEGRGDDQPCRLTRIAATEQVRVGDEVYTAGRDTLLPFPMYYGTIVRVEHQPGEECWDIDVEPAARRVELQTVQILRQRVNADRILAQ